MSADAPFLVDPQRKHGEVPYHMQPHPIGCVETIAYSIAGLIGIYVAASAVMGVYALIFDGGQLGGAGIPGLVFTVMCAPVLLMMGILPWYYQYRNRRLAWALAHGTEPIAGTVEKAYIKMKEGEPQLIVTYIFTSPATGKPVKGTFGVGAVPVDRTRPGDGRPAPAPGTLIRVVYVSDRLHTML